MNLRDITWKVHLSSSPEKVYFFLSTDEGRAGFWAESAKEKDGVIEWEFPNGLELKTEIIRVKPPGLFSVEYFGGSVVTFELRSDGKGGTDLTLTDSGVNEDDWNETYAGWLSVLMTLKGAVDFGIDLRNHDKNRSWDEGYADN